MYILLKINDYFLGYTLNEHRFENDKRKMHRQVNLMKMRLGTDLIFLGTLCKTPEARLING